MKKEIDDYVMTHPQEWKKILSKFGFRYDFGIKNIIVEKSKSKSKKSKKTKFLFTFPKPKVVPECFFAILFIEHNSYKYYTLELDIEGCTVLKDSGIICGQNRTQHINYGRRCKNDLAEFEKSIQDLIDGKPDDINEDYKNIDHKEFSKILVIKEEEFNKKFFIY